MNEAYTCHNCGAPYDSKTGVCTYCGTHHKVLNDNSIMSFFPVQVLPQNADKLRVRSRLDPFLLDSIQSGMSMEELSRFLTSQISKELANMLIPYMSFETHLDPCRNEVLIQSELTVMRLKDSLTDVNSRKFK